MTSFIDMLQDMQAKHHKQGEKCLEMSEVASEAKRVDDAQLWAVRARKHFDFESELLTLIYKYKDDFESEHAT